MKLIELKKKHPKIFELWLAEKKRQSVNSFNRNRIEEQIAKANGKKIEFTEEYLKDNDVNGTLHWASSVLGADFWRNVHEGMIPSIKSIPSERLKILGVKNFSKMIKADLVKEIENFENRILEADALIDKLKEEEINLTSTINQLKEENHNLENRIFNLKNDVERLQNDLDSLLETAKAGASSDDPAIYLKLIVESEL